MCGIAAIATPGGLSPHAFSRLQAASALLASRGPDGAGTFTDVPAGIAMSHTRLAINDLSEAGAQPMTTPSGRWTLVVNGEIYNALEMRSRLQSAGAVFRSGSDSEALLHAIDVWGVRRAIDTCRGMFAFVAWDAHERTLWAAVDHAGMKPLVYASSQAGLTVASDLDALAELMGGYPEPDGVGLAQVLCLGYCPAPRTVYKGIHALEPGRLLRWDARRGVHVERWWSPPQESSDVSEFEPLWTSVVSDHELSNVPIGVLLSGGLDSSAVACAASIRGDAPLAVTLALEGPESEAQAAAEIAGSLGLNHATATLTHADAPAVLDAATCVYDQPQAYGALLTMTQVARTTSRHRRVVLSGDGGDEAMGGYSWQRTPQPVRAGEAPDPADPTLDGDGRRAALRALACRSFVHAHLQACFPRFHPREAEAMLAPLDVRDAEDAYVEHAAHEDCPTLPELRRRQRLDLMTFCAGSICPKIDRAAMAVGLEIRCPFLDRRVLEWGLARPVEVSEQDVSGSKPVLRRYLAGRVPDGVLTRKKQGFSLRLGAADPWTPMLDEVEDGPLVSHGILAPRWREYVSNGAPNAHSRAFALCFLSGWFSRRIPRAAALETPIASGR